MPRCAAMLLLLTAGTCRREGEQPAITESQPEPAPVLELRETTPAHPHQPVQFVVTARTSSGEPMTLESIGGELVHIVAVRRDLSWLAHAHPRPSDSGAYAFDLTFPKEGRYVVFAVLVPAGAERQTLRRELVVGASASTPDAQLAPTPRDRRFHRYDVQLATQPPQPVSGSWSTVTFHLTRDGAPVTDLRAHADSGHLVILDESAEHFVYAHSTDGEALSGVRAKAHVPAAPTALRPHQHDGDDRGPDVRFHALFPAPGRYKIWAEFAPRNDHVTAEFVIDVAEGKGGLQ